MLLSYLEWNKYEHDEMHTGIILLSRGIELRKVSRLRYTLRKAVKFLGSLRMQVILLPGTCINM